MGNGTMADFTGFLQVLVLDRPVVDRTGITGRYDLQFKFTPDDSLFNGHGRTGRDDGQCRGVAGILRGDSDDWVEAGCGEDSRGCDRDRSRGEDSAN